jgi:hypothetical protein
MKSRSVFIFLGAVFAMTLTATSQDKKPINAKCPVKGQPVKASITAEFEGKVIGFC